ncbi:RluA family pseudouridine synthase [Candidatus Saccharibacteria bacterium]|nr:RluA family pseudouridine synthase [Candidatus Saccharibacteria bacterium]
MTRDFDVAAGVASGRLDVYLAAELGWSRNAVTTAIKSGRIVVDGRPAKASQPVLEGETISVAEPVLPDVTSPPQSLSLPIVYDDADMIVVDKPAGIAVHGGNAQSTAGTVAEFAKLHTTDLDPDRPGIVHRLDKETSGLLVIAKTAAAKADLQHRWQQREVHKTYRLLVIGRVEEDAAIIDLPLDRNPAIPTRRAVHAAGRPATTRYKTLAVYPGYTYVEAYPETGRTHQLRVHFAAIGHPIAGDITYGAPKRPLGLTRHFLHAAGLKLVAPSGKPLELASPLPTQLEAVLRQLEASA